MDRALIVIDPGHGGEASSFYDLDNGVRLSHTWEEVLGFSREADEPRVERAGPAGSDEADLEPRFYFRQNGRKITYGDPGHLAAERPDMPEKDVVLDVSRTLRRELGELFVVKTTRDRDGYVAAGRRVHCANRALEKHPGAAAFLSLHADGSDDPQTHGCVVYRLPGRSRRLADVVGGALVRHLEGLGRRSCPVEIRERDVPLLRQIEMPALRLQLGSMSHPEDVRRLLDRHCREALARELAQALEVHFRRASLPAAAPAARALGRSVMPLIEARG